MDSNFEFNKFVRTTLITKIVLYRIISIVRMATVQCKLDRLINRDDDAKRSPLSAKHVASLVFVTNDWRRLMTVPSPPLGGYGGGDRILSG